METQQNEDIQKEKNYSKKSPLKEKVLLITTVLGTIILFYTLYIVVLAKIICSDEIEDTYELALSQGYSGTKGIIVFSTIYGVLIFKEHQLINSVSILILVTLVAFEIYLSRRKTKHSKVR